MPEIEVRPAQADDIPGLVEIEHNYVSDYVWQMDLQVDSTQSVVNFRKIRLPRSVKVEYPRPMETLFEEWPKRCTVLTAVFEQKAIGYIRLKPGVAPNTVWVTDMAVASLMRRKGIASALLLAAQEWAIHKKQAAMIVEMQSKNHAAIELVKKLGFEFCGYNDHYYGNQDIALFYARFLR
jgi:ribosomal protein S18 acetylase RimI-like enzyme